MRVGSAVRAVDEIGGPSLQGPHGEVEAEPRSGLEGEEGPHGDIEFVRRRRHRLDFVIHGGIDGLTRARSSRRPRVV